MLAGLGAFKTLDVQSTTTPHLRRPHLPLLSSGNLPLPFSQVRHTAGQAALPVSRLLQLSCQLLNTLLSGSQVSEQGVIARQLLLCLRVENGSLQQDGTRVTQHIT